MRNLQVFPQCNKIISTQGTDPLAVRPYCYRHAQKDETERQCAKMLDKVIIRSSTTPFSSPVLLVKKSDGSWNFCIDYHALKSKPIKDTFPIPVIDELNRYHYFSKLDLPAGYHQLLMDSTGVHITAFRTHHGHFEF